MGGMKKRGRQCDELKINVITRFIEGRLNKSHDMFIFNSLE